MSATRSPAKPMRHTVSIHDDIGREIERFASEEGISISEFYARAAEERLKQIRRRRAIEAFDRRAGTIETHGDFDEALRKIRQEDPERA